MKILILSDLFPEFEGDWKGIYIVDYLSALQDHCELAVLNSKLIGSFKGEMEMRHNEFFITRYRHQTHPSLNKLYAYQSWLRNSIRVAQRFNGVDIIHAHGSVLQGTLARKLAKKWDIPYVISEHTGPFSSITRSPLKRQWAKRAIKNADSLLVVSERLKNEITESGIQAKRTIVTYNPIDTSIFKVGLKGPHQQLVFVSRLDEFKGGLRTLKAFHSVVAKYPDWRLAIIGDGEEFKQIRDYIVRNRLHHVVNLFGMLSKEEIYGVLKRSDFLVFPSRHESFGLVAAEAMATGIPVIVSSKCGVAEIVHEGNGLIINPDSIGEIEFGIDHIINNLEKYNREQIREEIIAKLSLPVFGENLIEEYQKIIATTTSQLA